MNVFALAGDAQNIRHNNDLRSPSESGKRPGSSGGRPVSSSGHPGSAGSPYHKSPTKRGNPGGKIDHVKSGSGKDRAEVLLLDSPAATGSVKERGYLFSNSAKKRLADKGIHYKESQNAPDEDEALLVSEM